MSFHVHQILSALKDISNHVLYLDNGKGLSKSLNWIAYARKGHLGIVGMKERAEAIGGTFQVISQPGEGTLVLAIVPLADDNR